jgi:hypothetical protein
MDLKEGGDVSEEHANIALRESSYCIHDYFSFLTKLPVSYDSPDCKILNSQYDKRSEGTKSYSAHVDI